MARAKRGFKRRKRVKKVYDAAEGFVLGRRKIFRRADEAVRRAGKYAYKDRKRRKRTFRELWITRLSAATSENQMSYSRFISALGKSGIGLDRKVLSDIAIADPRAFAAIVDQVRAAAPAH